MHPCSPLAEHRDAEATASEATLRRWPTTLRAQGVLRSSLAPSLRLERLTPAPLGRLTLLQNTSFQDWSFTVSDGVYSDIGFLNPLSYRTMTEVLNALTLTASPSRHHSAAICIDTADAARPLLSCQTHHGLRRRDDRRPGQTVLNWPPKPWARRKPTESTAPSSPLICDRPKAMTWPSAALKALIERPRPFHHHASHADPHHQDRRQNAPIAGRH